MSLKNDLPNRNEEAIVATREKGLWNKCGTQTISRTLNRAGLVSSGNDSFLLGPLGGLSLRLEKEELDLTQQPFRALRSPGAELSGGWALQFLVAVGTLAGVYLS